jgi:hypothetical protein
MLKVCNFFVVFVKKVQQFSDGMKIMLDIEDDAVYVNMTGQNPSYYQLFRNKRGLSVW